MTLLNKLEDTLELDLSIADDSDREEDEIVNLGATPAQGNVLGLDA